MRAWTAGLFVGLTLRCSRLFVALTVAASLSAQSPPPPVSGAAGLEVMLRKLEHTGVVMITNAHPDDEPNALIAMLALGLGVRVVEVTATRGEGGQNDLGPEQGLALSVLRTEELLATHRIDGAEQMFARAVDFGYSFSVEESFAKWGHDEILADYVRIIRMIRPDVIISMSPDGDGGGQHHQASARITREAFDKAGDPNAFPEQIQAGLMPWAPARLYVPIGAPPAADDAAASRPESRSESRAASRRRLESRRSESRPESRPGDVTVDTDVFDTALGCTYHEIGTRARGMHKSQGMARLLALPGPSVQRYRVAAGSTGVGGPTPAGPGGELFRGIGIGFEMPQRANGDLMQELANLKEMMELQIPFIQVRAAVETGAPAAAVVPLAQALRVVSRMREALVEPRTSDPKVYEVDQVLAEKQAQLRRAIVIAGGLRIEALADAGVVVPGQEIKVSVYVANRIAPDFGFSSVGLQGFDPSEGGCATRPSTPLAPGALMTCESKRRVPNDARVTSAHWKPIPGVSRSEWEPDVPFGAPFRPTPFRARVTVSVGSVLINYDVPIEFRDGSDVFAGEKRHELLVVPDGPDADVERIEYTHTNRRHLLHPPKCVRPTFELKLDTDKVGWIRGVGDRLDEAIHCFGTTAEPVDEGVIKAGGLDRYPAIVIGSRALELRPEIRAVGGRLREYVERGGTVVILYQRSGLDEGTVAPYPGKTGGNRITDENTPVKVLVPDHPLFNVPNKIGAEDWTGWVQERGRNFFETKDTRYVDLVEMEDPFDFNKGAKRGILVEAKAGKGRWIYCGLALSRQLDDGVPGAYRLLANLLSLRGDRAER